MNKTPKGRPKSLVRRDRIIHLYLTEAQHETIRKAAAAANDPMSRYCVRMLLAQVGANS